jgi:hypothetical protein
MPKISEYRPPRPSSHFRCAHIRCSGASRMKGFVLLLQRGGGEDGVGLAVVRLGDRCARAAVTARKDD